MNYKLRASEGSSKDVASADLADGFAAETWAREWVKANATESAYRLEGSDGNFVRLLFKTDAGQWYLTPEPAIA